MESALYGMHALVVSASEVLLVRFLIRQQLVRKYRTPALSMKYSLYIELRYIEFCYIEVPLNEREREIGFTPLPGF